MNLQKLHAIFILVLFVLCLVSDVATLHLDVQEKAEHVAENAGNTEILDALLKLEGIFEQKETSHLERFLNDETSIEEDSSQSETSNEEDSARVEEKSGNSVDTYLAPSHSGNGY